MTCPLRPPPDELAMRLEVPYQKAPRAIPERYQLEKQLAAVLRNASRLERRLLYGRLYDELFRQFPQLIDGHSKRGALSGQIKVLQRHLLPQHTYLEIGAGDCRLSLEVSKRVRRVCALEVSRTPIGRQEFPANMHLVVFDGVSIPLAPESVDVCYSNQVLEHLHPEDALEQLSEVYTTLKDNGIYICRTPNRLSGPHDVSRYLDIEAKGLHLKEYTSRELANLFRTVGFAELSFFAAGQGLYLHLPCFAIFILESMITRLHFRASSRISRLLPVMVLLGINILGKK